VESEILLLKLLKYCGVRDNTVKIRDITVEHVRLRAPLVKNHWSTLLLV